jgi:hypothetical protein
MSEQANALVQKLVEEGEWPAPTLLEEIVAQGQEAVEPLLEILRTRPRGWPAEAPLDHAMILLCALRPPEALPALMDVLRDYSNETAETVSECAAVYGAAAVDPALALVSDATLNWYSRSSATGLAMQAAADDSDLRARIALTIREVLAQLLAKAPQYVGAEEAEAEDSDEFVDEEAEDDGDGEPDEDELEEELGALTEENAEDEQVEVGQYEHDRPPPGSPEDYFQLATCLVTDLATLADPQGRHLIQAAFAADIVDRWMIDERSVEEFYREGARKDERPDPRAPLERYRERYEEHLAQERRKPLDLLEPPARALPPATYDPVEEPLEEPPLKPFDKTEKMPGRNEPCWCGSGKKYKHCHMREDRK